MSRSALTVAVLACMATLAFVAAGCDVGKGEGSVDGSLFIRQCAKRTSVGNTAAATPFSFGTPDAPVAYAMNPSFFAAEPIDDFSRLMPNNRLNIRIQSDGARIEQADVLFINIASIYSIAQAVGTDIEVGPTTNLRATLMLNQSCSSPEVTPALEGTIHFTQLGDANLGRVQPDFRISFEDRLAATFNFRFVDLRAATLGGVGEVPVDPAVGGNLSGYFDFVVRQGQRAQSYP